jgi:hypothetical protein
VPKGGVFVSESRVSDRAPARDRAREPLAGTARYQL